MNIIFDIGNVICEWSPEKLLQTIFDDPGQCEVAMQAIIQHRDWHELDRGSIDMEQAKTNAVARCSLEPDLITSVFQQTPVSLIPHKPVVKLIKDLKSRGHALYVLSNMQQHSWEYLYARYDFWTLFDGIVVSFEVKMTKPAVEIFRHIMQKYRLENVDTVFLDDMYENIAAASNFGLQTIHVEDIAELENRLNQILKKEP